MPNPSAVRVDGSTFEITEGTTRGENLFHSFSEFSLPEGAEARFENATSIRNILTRVTGNAASDINGLIRANGTANLFIINPNGVIFGPGARLDIGGSFAASTAERVQFADGTEFSAIATAAPPLLTVSVPVGLQFGTRAEPIEVRGAGNNLFTSDVENFVFEVDRSARTVGLAVAPGRTLALIGGDLIFTGGNVTAETGRIELGSVAAGEGVGLTLLADNNLTLDYEPGTTFRDVTLRAAASVDVSGTGSGTVRVRGNNISVLDGSAILANVLGDASGGELSLQAAGTVTVAGIEADNFFSSLVSTDAASTATGTGSDLFVASDRLVVTAAGQISSSTFGAARAGSLTIQTQDIELSGSLEDIVFTGLFAFVGAGASGDGGGLFINPGDGPIGTQTLRVSGDVLLEASTFGSGDAGSVVVRAAEIELLGTELGGTPFLTVDVGFGGSGNAGNLTVVADRLRLEGGAQVGASAFGDGDAGTIDIQADLVELDGGNDFQPSSILASTVTDGRGGTVAIRTGLLRVTDSAQVQALTFGPGPAGDLTVIASDVELVGGNAQGRSGLIANALVDSGAGGNVTVATDRLLLQDGATITVGNFSTSGQIPPGSGPAGSLNVMAQSVALAGGSTLTADTVAGDAANITLTGLDRLSLADGSSISAGATEAGSGGSITIEANAISLAGNSTIASDAPSGAGNITLSATGSDGLRLQNSEIAATGGEGNLTIDAPLVILEDISTLRTDGSGTTPGGNLTIDTNAIVAFASDAPGNDITANAANAAGGQVDITASGIFGIQSQPAATPGNDITATSALGSEFSGVVQVTDPVVDPTGALVTLQARPIDLSTQVVASCERLRGNELILTGRGGVPQSPLQPMGSRRTWSDFRLAATLPQTTARVAAPPAEPPRSPGAPERIVEARGWQQTVSGEVVLVARQGPVAIDGSGRAFCEGQAQ